ncbi:hypothetical protein ABZ119_09245 [Streptomyces sp. NPDC006288]|uniref:hypothetical protein n=1 Tax=Streptomyces sp. NPDC006288 TaxID=3156743 RepID=UPI0033B41FF5
MIGMNFSVRPGQGESSGFDLGDIVCEGDSGMVGSVGHVPDQGMMIYLSVTHLLDSLRVIFTGERKEISFTGSDTSFRLDFERDKSGFVSVFARGELLGKSSVEDLARAVLGPAQDLADGGLSRLPIGDPVRSDYLSAVEEIRNSVA